MAELTSTANAVWHGGLSDGSGTVSLASGAAGPLPVSWASRTEAAHGKTSPEELIGAAHAACYSMAFSNDLAAAGGTPKELNVTAKVTFAVTEKGAGITGVALTVTGSVDGLDADGFAKVAESAKENCPVSRALAVPITLTVN
ncbi:MAG: lipoyl-dependent peroxiredoxin [Gaiellaceae bacterium]|jgi:osmotically inducible protein OsmC|nr:lipoyl-dependent peroxiredoxin [Gaiellaceae bacterium]